MSSPPGIYGATDPLFLLLLALALEAYIGDRPLSRQALPYPRRLVGRLVGLLERRLNRADRPPEVLRVRGRILAAGLTAMALVAGVGVALVTRFYPFAWILEALLLVTLVSQRGTWRRLAAVHWALGERSPVSAREALWSLAEGRIPREELERLDAAQIAAAAVPALGDRFAGRLVSPVLWYALLGLPGLSVQLCVSIAAARLSRGRPLASVGDFARAVVALDSWIAVLPDRLAGLLLAASAAVMPQVRSLAAFRRLPGSAQWPRAALVAALGLVADDQTQVAAPGPDLLSDALTLFVGACLLNAGLVALILLLGFAF